MNFYVSLPGGLYRPANQWDWHHWRTNRGQRPFSEGGAIVRQDRLFTAEDAEDAEDAEKTPVLLRVLRVLRGESSSSPSPGVLVSTVFLGVDLSRTDPTLPEHIPLIFETQVFGGPFTLYRQRYETEWEALEGHGRLLAAVKAEGVRT